MVIRRVTVKKSKVTAKKSSAVKQTCVAEVSDQKFYKSIEKKAYELFENRGGIHGNDWSDWLEAERVVKAGK